MLWRKHEKRAPKEHVEWLTDKQAESLVDITTNILAQLVTNKVVKGALLGSIALGAGYLSGQGGADLLLNLLAFLSGGDSR